MPQVVITPVWKVSIKFGRNWSKPVTVEPEGKYKAFYEKLMEAVKRLEEGEERVLIDLPSNPFGARFAEVCKGKKQKGIYELALYCLILDCALEVKEG